MKSQPGWSVYILMLTLTCLTLLSLRTINRSTEQLSFDFDGRAKFATEVASTDVAELAEAAAVEAGWHWADRSEWMTHFSDRVHTLIFHSVPQQAARRSMSDVMLTGSLSGLPAYWGASHAVTNQPCRRPIWRQSFWKAHCQLLQSEATRSLFRVLELTSWVAWHDLHQRRSLADQMAFGAMGCAISHVHAPHPSYVAGLGQPTFQSPHNGNLFELIGASWLVEGFEHLSIQVRQRQRQPAQDAPDNADLQLASAHSENAEESDGPDPTLPRATAQAVWPYPESLAYRIDALRSDANLVPWVEVTLTRIDQLANQPSLRDPAVLETLYDLQNQLNILDGYLAPQITQREAGHLRSLRYELAKWIQVWHLAHVASQDVTPDSVHQPAGSQTTTMSVAEYDSLQSAMTAIETELARYPNNEPWRQYLELDRVHDMLGRGSLTEDDHKVCETVLLRFDVARLDAAQSFVLTRPVFQQFHDAVVPLTASQVDISEMLWLLVMYEKQPWNMIEERLMTNTRKLSWSPSPATRHLGEFVEAHFRNANFRIAISEEMMNRLIPVQQSMNEPVSDVVLGARVLGQSETSNRLSFRLVPDPYRMHIELVATGEVRSRTRAMTDFFVFHNRGTGSYVAEKGIVITPRQLFLNPTQAAADNENQTTAVESDFDALPFVGEFVRALAIEKQNEMAPLARRIAERKIAGTARQRIDEEVEARMTHAREELDQRLISPLDTMAIAIDPIHFETTPQRLIMRYRVAGTEQLAGFGARPQALSSSMMSMQVHQSVLNNLVRRLELDGREFQIGELYEHLSQVTGRDIPAPDDMDPNVHLKFAPSDCVEFRFIENRIQVTLRFSELRVGRNTRWRNISIEADYQPELNGLQVNLVRIPESTLRLPGRQVGFRDQMAIRTIFNKVFDANQVLPTTPEDLLTDARFQGLEVSQCEIRDGWVGLSLGTRE